MCILATFLFYRKPVHKLFKYSINYKIVFQLKIFDFTKYKYIWDVLILVLFYIVKFGDFVKTYIGYRFR